MSRTFEEIMTDYGRCDHCGKKIKSGDTTKRINTIKKFQSQGYPSEFETSSYEYCTKCFIDEIIKKDL